MPYPANNADGEKSESDDDPRTQFPCGNVVNPKEIHGVLDKLQRCPSSIRVGAVITFGSTLVLDLLVYTPLPALALETLLAWRTSILPQIKNQISKIKSGFLSEPFSHGSRRFSRQRVLSKAKEGLFSVE
jgi:hypothetical protein